MKLRSAVFFTSFFILISCGLLLKRLHSSMIYSYGRATAICSDVAVTRSRTVETNDDDQLWTPIKTRSKQYVATPNAISIKPVIILTYQRCGSTFFGKLFNLNDDAFYSYEPLDAYYTSLYGTKPGWNSPSDIVSFRNGSRRNLPDVELFGVAKFLGNLLNCRADRLPTEQLLHPFWSVPAAIANSSAASDYWRCLCSHRMKWSLEMTEWRIVRHCGKMFRDRSPEDHERCRLLLNDVVDYRFQYPNTSISGSFNLYRTLLARKRQKLERTCLPLFRSMCSSRPLRVAKVVRATMLSMRPLLERLPNLRVIHLVRDPRAVALSRRAADSSYRGQFTDLGVTPTEVIVREATIYCRQVVTDLRWKSELERDFPERFYSLTYEQLVDNPALAVDIHKFFGVGTAPESVIDDFFGLAERGTRKVTAITTTPLLIVVFQLVENPFQQAVDIYKFLGIGRPPTSVIDSFVELANRGTRNVTARTNASIWRSYVTEEESNEIIRYCSEMFDLYPQYIQVQPTVKNNSSVAVVTYADELTNFKSL